MKEFAVKAAKDAVAGIKAAKDTAAKDFKKTKEMFFKIKNEIKFASKSVEQGQAVHESQDQTVTQPSFLKTKHFYEHTTFKVFAICVLIVIIFSMLFILSRCGCSRRERRQEAPDAKNREEDKLNTV